MSSLKIIWSKQAKQAVKSIYDFYKEKSVQGAKNVKNDLLQALKTIHFAEQYQIDEINPKYRRIVCLSTEIKRYHHHRITSRSKIVQKIDLIQILNPQHHNKLHL